MVFSFDKEMFLTIFDHSNFKDSYFQKERQKTSRISSQTYFKWPNGHSKISQVESENDMILGFSICFKLVNIVLNPLPMKRAKCDQECNIYKHLGK